MRGGLREVGRWRASKLPERSLRSEDLDYGLLCSVVDLAGDGFWWATLFTVTAISFV